MLDNCIVCMSQEEIQHDSLVDEALIRDTLLNSVLLLSFKKEEKQSPDLSMCKHCYIEVDKLYRILDQLEKIKIEFETLKENILQKCISSVVRGSNVKGTSLKEATEVYPKNSLEFKIYKKWRGRCKQEFLKQVSGTEKPDTSIKETSTNLSNDHCYSTASQSKLDGGRYLARRIKTTPYTCSQCDMLFHRQARLREHVSTCHDNRDEDRDDSKSKILTCPVTECGLEFRQMAVLKQHLTKIHTQDQFDKCQDCHKIFRINEDDGQSSHCCSFSKKCKLCGKSFSTKKTYQIHVQEKQCEKTKVTAVNVREKIKQELKCSHCSRTFTSKQGLFYHLSSHTGEKSFGCDVCRKRFVNASQLQIHQRIHSGDKPYICQLCGDRFSSLPGLSSHLKTHAAIKPYKCTVCEKTFRSAGHLSKHSLIHSGQRPFSCPSCQRSFNRKENLSAHELTHRNVKPHVCPTCPSTSFTRAGLLRKHLRNKHCPLMEPVLCQPTHQPIIFENKQQTIVCVDHLPPPGVNILCNLPSTTQYPLTSAKTSGQNNDLTLNEAATVMQETLFFTNADGEQYLILKE